MKPDGSDSRRGAWRCKRLDIGLLSLLLLLGSSTAGIRGAEVANGSPAVPSQSPPVEATSADSADPASGPERLQREVRLVVTTNTTSAGESTGAASEPKEKTVKWSLSCKGWDGLYFEAATKTSLKKPGELLGLQSPVGVPLVNVHLEQVKMSGRLGGRLEVDGAAFLTTGDLTSFDDGVQLRRLLVSLGGDCILVLPVSYYVELGYAAGGFSLNKTYLTFAKQRYLGELKVGQFQAPMGLQLITSSRDISFMEPAAPLQALAPGTEVGIQIGRSVFAERATWALGLFAPGAGSLEYGNASKNYGSVIGRGTALPVYEPNATNAAANRLLHLGLSGNILYSASSTVRYQSRPESYISPIVIDTGDIDASSATTFAGELAWVNGPFSAQGEAIGSVVNLHQGGQAGFYGFYAQASWFLTGESRPYNPATGAFSRLVPRHNFNFGRGGWGALEVATRYSYTDLDGGSIHGERLRLLMTSLNWYLQPHVRWMFDYGMGRLSGGPQEGSMFIFQTRISLDF